MRRKGGLLFVVLGVVAMVVAVAQQRDVRRKAPCGYNECVCPNAAVCANTACLQPGCVGTAGCPRGECPYYGDSIPACVPQNCRAARCVWTEGEDSVYVQEWQPRKGYGRRVGHARRGGCCRW